MVLAALCGAALACSASARANTVSGTLDVSLRILPGCSVSAAPLAFVAEAGASAEAEATIDVRCAGDTRVSLSLDRGMNAAGVAYGRIEARGTAVATGDYRDTVTVTVAF